MPSLTLQCFALLLVENDSYVAESVCSGGHERTGTDMLYLFLLSRVDTHAVYVQFEQSYDAREENEDTILPLFFSSTRIHVRLS